MNKKDIWQIVLRIIVSAATAALTALGVA